MNTVDWIEDDLQRLEQQRQRYELALLMAPTPAARERHLRNVARLEEEIAGRREALQSVTPPPVRVEVVDVTGRYAALIDGAPVGQTHKIVAIAILVAFALGFLAVALIP